MNQRFFILMFGLSAIVMTPTIAAAQTTNTTSSNQPKQAANTLTLNRLLGALENHPKARAARQDVVGAQGKRREAQGAFDPKVKGKGFWQPLAKEYALFDLSLMQPLAFWGTDVIVGWRAGMGPVPVYKGEMDSATPFGEFYAGVNLPLLRNRAIDARRAKRQIANMTLRAARMDLRLQMLLLQQDAIKAYTEWLAAGWLLQLDVERLALLKDRVDAFSTRLKLGDLAKIDRLDIERTFESQKAQVIKSKQAFFKAQAKLALYWRDDKGRTQMADAQMLPKPSLTLGQLQNRTDAQWKKLLKRHPRLRRMELDLKILRTKRDLAEEGIKPKLDLQPQVVQSVGPNTLGWKEKQNEVAIGLVFEMPFFQNKARGKVAQLTAKQRGTRFKQQQELDALWAIIQTNLNNFRQAQRQVGHLRKAWKLALQVEQLERDKMKLGESSWFKINAREAKTLETYRKLVDAYQKAIYYQYSLDLINQLPAR